MPVYIALRSQEKDQKTLISMRIKLKKYGPDEVWFPNETLFRIACNGKVNTEEIVTVEDAVFGEDISDETFSLAGLGLPKGRAVLSKGKFLTWDGDRLVGDGGFQPEQPPEVSGTRFAMVASSLSLAVIAAVLLWYRMRRRNA